MHYPKFGSLVLIVAFTVSIWHGAAQTVSAKGKPNTIKKVANGKGLFQANGCLDCHSVGGKGCESGVKLDGIGKRRNRKFLEEQLRDPDSHVQKNKDEFHGDPSLMANPNLTEKEIQLLVDYLQTL